jgi:hypothetical protein
VGLNRRAVPYGTATGNDSKVSVSRGRRAVHCPAVLAFGAEIHARREVLVDLNHVSSVTLAAGEV